MIPTDELVQMLADPRSGLSVTPLIDAPRQIGEGSVDIRLGPDIIVSPKATGATTFDPTDPLTFERHLRQRQQYIRRGVGDPFQLQPGEFVIGRSLEYVALPRGVSAEVLGRSSWGRLGLVIATATLIQPSFKGTITLELANVGDTPIMLTVGLSIAQLVFTRDHQPRPAWRRRRFAGLGRPASARVQEWRERHRRLTDSAGRYKLQIKPALSRLHMDDDLKWVTPLAVPYVVGIVGEHYAGKSTAVDFLATRKHFRLYRLTQFVAEEARRRGRDSDDRATLRAVAREMREERGDAVLAQLAFERIRAELLDPDRSRQLVPVVIEGFRVPAEIEAWQDLEFFRPIVVEADIRIRRQRAVEGGWLDRDELERDGYPFVGTEQERDRWFAEHVDAPPDGWRYSELVATARERADHLTIDNNGTSVKELRETLDERVRELERWWRKREY